MGSECPASGRCRLTIKRTLLLVLVSVGWLLFGVSPLAAEQPEPQLIVGLPEEAGLGEHILIAAYLLDPVGNPVAGQGITFFVEAEFMNTLGLMEIGQSKTDESGLAVFTYEVKLAGDRNITARFAGNDVFASASASVPILIAYGGETYIEEMPFRVPGLNVWAVVTLIGLVWGIYLFVGAMLIVLARARDSEDTSVEVAS